MDQAERTETGWRGSREGWLEAAYAALVTEGVVSMKFKAASEDLARIVHAHPSLSEVVHEAALAADKRALHG